MLVKQELFQRRKRRARIKLRRASSGRHRLSVFRSGKHIYAQVIDDTMGNIVVSSSSLEKSMKLKLANGANKEAAGQIGKTIAERALAIGVKDVVFDRGAYKYHGRVKALAEAARESGLNF